MMPGHRTCKEEAEEPYCAKRSMKTIHGVKACDIDSFHSGQMVQSLLDIGIYILHQLKKKIFEQNLPLLHVATENCFHISKLIFRAGVQKGEIRRGCGQEIPRKISVASRMTGVDYTNALIREFSLNI